jgi:hypothetical protein
MTREEACARQAEGAARAVEWETEESGRRPGGLEELAPAEQCRNAGFGGVEA